MVILNGHFAKMADSLKTFLNGDCDICNSETQFPSSAIWIYPPNLRRRRIRSPVTRVPKWPLNRVQYCMFACAAVGQNYSTKMKQPPLLCLLLGQPPSPLGADVLYEWFLAFPSLPLLSFIP